MEIIFAAAITGLMLDILLSATWNSTYFSFGVPVYKKRYRLKGSHYKDINSSIQQFGDNKLWSNYRIKQTNNSTFYLRKNLWHFTLNTLIPFTRWKLTVDENGQYIHLNAFLMYFPTLIILSIGFESLITFGIIMAIIIVWYFVGKKINLEPFHSAELEKICQFISN